jgi:uncharacterized protein (DUF1501 family)
MSCREDLLISRRRLLAGTAASLALWSLKPRIASAAGTADPRFLTIILRGGLDGLALAGPIGDPDYERLRGKLALSLSGTPAALPLDGMFGLNPAMPVLHDLYRRKQALIVHAAATPYRERSHFDGQDVLESGLGGVGLIENGWLNRALGMLASQGKANPKGLAMSPVVPLVMRGAAPVLSWTPKVYQTPLHESTILRLMDLYAETDPKLAVAFHEGVEIEKLAAPGAPQGQRPMREFLETAEAAAKFMTTPDGPRVGALSYTGWDTHANEGALQGQLYNRLSGLDAAIKAFSDGMGEAWKDTVVTIVTEFGRTARVNGTDGTDHGTGAVALVLGGAVRGGRVLADWPGLSEKALYQGRDLMPTTDLRGIFKGVLKDHLGIDGRRLDDVVFPGSAAAKPIDGLIGTPA